MAPSDLLCLYCHTPAFAVINVEIASGRGRWPTCHRLDCTGRALQDAGVRLANAANQQVIAAAQHPDAIETTVHIDDDGMANLDHLDDRN